MPRRRREQPAEHTDGGRLAGPIGPQETKNFALGHLQRDVVDGHKRAKRLHQVMDFHPPAIAVHGRASSPSTMRIVLINAPSRFADPVSCFITSGAEQRMSLPLFMS